MIKTISERGADLIKKHEGCRLIAYQDVVGVWTIGYGHTKTTKAGMKIWQSTADELLREDLRGFEAGVAKLVTVPITQNMFDALVSFSFNLGLGAFEESTLLRKLQDRQYLAACQEFPRWINAGGKPYLGLLRRRLEEAELFLRMGLPNQER